MELHAQRSSTDSRRATWFVSILLILVLGTAIVLSYSMLRTARDRIATSLEHSLTLPIQNRSSALIVWYSALQSEIDRLTQSDMLRLLATEVQSLGENGVKSLVELSRTEETSPADGNAFARLASQLPLMRTQLEQFVARSHILSATLLTRDMQPYLATGTEFVGDADWKQRMSDEAWAVADRAAEQGAPQVSPIRRGQANQLVMYLAYPIFAPEYVEMPDKKPVGLLLMTCDVTPIVRSMSLPRGYEQAEQEGCLIQKTGQGLEILVPDGVDAPYILPGWKADDFGDLPLGVYSLPDGTRLYAMGQGVPNLPWIVVQDELYEAVEARYAAERRSLLFAVGASTAIILLLIVMFWWWLVGQRERALAGEMRQLYHTVNQQHQLLRGINSTMADGIMMLDREGAVQYANDAFAAMAGKRAEEVIGHSLAGSFSKLAADRMVRLAGQILRGHKAETFNEELPLDQGRRHYQIACSPFQQEDGTVTGVVSVFRDITELVKAQKHAQTMIHQTVNVLVRAIEAVDPYLRGQSMYTGMLAAYLAQGLHLDTGHVTTVRTAASLSQIGMIQLPRELVNKTSALTPEERAELERHVEYARNTLTGIDFGLPVQEAIYEMHEHMDGSGYPQGLKGDAISLNARILGVANTFCALVRPRSYRQEHSVEEALAILSETPPQYDPQIVDALRTFLETPQGREFLEALQRKEVF